jgi:glycosyltransferase involved in cell wall biosynthesis
LVGDGPERGKLEHLVKELNLQQNVKFLGLRRDVPRLLKAADLFLLTSISEGIPLTLIEAMAAGLPIVATNVGGVGEVVENGVTGVLVRVGDSEAIAQQILNQPRVQEQNRLHQNSLSHAIRLFDEAAMIHSYAEVYDRLSPK